MNLLEVTIYIFLPLTFLIIVIILWNQYGKDKKMELVLIEKIPDDLNILQVSYLYNNEITEKDIKPFIIQLANDGHIKIKKDKNRYKLIKNNLPEDKIKLYFINELFGNNQEIDINEKKKKILKIMNVISKEIISKYEVDEIYEKKSLSKKALTKLMILIIYVIIILKLLFDIQNMNLFLFLIILPSLGMKLLFKMFLNKKNKIRILGIIVSLFLILYPLITLETKINNIKYSNLYFISLIIIDIMIIFNVLMPKLKTNIVKLKSKINGFKNYISENNNIINNIKENSDYYYEIYAYSCIFGIDKKIEQIRNIITVLNPTWYEEK